MAVAGVPPRIMVIGLVPATSEALGTGVSLDDVGLNEAFAARVLAVLQG
jgi:acetyl-CoA acetyltransferase